MSEQYHQGNTNFRNSLGKISNSRVLMRRPKLQINAHRGGRKSKPFSPGTDFVGVIFTGELSGVDSAGLLWQCGYYIIQANM